MDERYNLDNLRDIVVPEPPAFWPPAAEFWLLLIVVLATIALLVLQVRRRHRFNAYRRAGLTLLDRARTVYEISVILKRVALAAFPREQVASLYGTEWSDFLHRTCSTNDFALLVQTDPDSPASAELRRLADTWIRRHRVPPRAEDA